MRSEADVLLILGAVLEAGVSTKCCSGWCHFDRQFLDSVSIDFCFFLYMGAPVPEKLPQNALSFKIKVRENNTRHMKRKSPGTT